MMSGMQIYTIVHVVISLLAIGSGFLVLIVQSFQKAPALKALAPTQSEAPFVTTQLIAMAAFIVLGVLAAIRFRERPVSMV